MVATQHKAVVDPDVEAWVDIWPVVLWKKPLISLTGETGTQLLTQSA